MLDAGYLGAVIGRAAGRDQDGFRRDLLAGGEPQRVGILDHRAGLDDARTGLLDIGGIDALEPRDLLVLVGNHGRPVEGRFRDGPAEARGVVDFVADMRADHEQLLRHAAADHAGAAHPVFFGDHHPRAVAGRDPGGAYPARTSSDDKQVDVELSHAPPRPVLSRSRDQICLPRLRISARNAALTCSANCWAHCCI